MKSVMKKTLALLLALVLSFSVTTVALGALGTGGVMKSYSATSIEDFHAEEFEGRIGRIIFLNLSEEDFPDNVTYVAEMDLSASEDTGTVTAKLVLSQNIAGINNLDMYIGAYDGVIAPADCSYLFAETGVREVIGLENFDTSGVTSMKAMFKNCGLREFNLDDFGDTSNVRDMSFMFNDCWYLEKITAQSFDTSSVSHFEHMFAGCSALTEFKVKNLDLSSASDLNYMFYECVLLTEADLSTWKNTSGMVSVNAFRNCPALETVKLSNWDLSSLVTLDGIFAACAALTDVYLCGVTQPTGFSSSWDNPLKGTDGINVHTDDIDFTSTPLWKDCFGKGIDVNVVYELNDTADMVNIDFERNEAVEYYTVTVNGDVRTIYGGSSMNIRKGTEIAIDIKASEEANPMSLNVNGGIFDFGTSFTVECDTTVSIQTYHDTTPIVPDKAEQTLTGAIFAIRDFINRIIDILQGFFGRFMPWIPEVEE